MNIDKKMIVTCALPYANGPLHIGHMLEHIQADIWVRFQKMKNNKVYFICADDAHGTAVMIKAKSLNLSIKKMIKNIFYEHKNDLLNFNISYDNYYTTHSIENKNFSELIFTSLKKSGYIKEKEISQLYDLKENIFLSDRFIKGNCPKCNKSDQYGDNCEKCGSTYNSIDLINPKSTFSNSVPIIKKTKHFFFDLPVFFKILKNWITPKVINIKVINKINEWFNSGLKMWDITRDKPYFGFKIPNAPGKYFYVWLDATIGYIGTFKNLCKKINIDFNEFWNKNSKTKLYHFIGKDVVYFHALFWPAILEAYGYRKPTKIFVHGYVTINGKKMSKSRGTLITAKTYLKHCNSDCIRYYYASKIKSEINDIDINLNDFVNKINSDIVNKLVNLASRSSSFINNYFNDKLSSELFDTKIYNIFVEKSILIESYYFKSEFSSVISVIINLLNLANKYIDDKKPWILIKNKYKYNILHNVCTTGINLFYIAMIYIKPILPDLSLEVENFLNINLLWENINKPILNYKINKFNKIFDRININNINKIFNEKNV